MDFISETCQPLLHFALPQYNHMPSDRPHRGVFLLDPRDIAVELGLAELQVGLRHRRRFAVRVPMPKAAVHEDDRMPLRKHDVWTVWMNGGESRTAEHAEMMAHDCLRSMASRYVSLWLVDLSMCFSEWFT